MIYLNSAAGFMRTAKLLVISFAFILNWQPTANAAEIQPVIAFGYDSGGDAIHPNMTPQPIVCAAAVGACPGLSDEVKAGEGFFYALGAYMAVADDVGVQATVGQKWSVISKDGNSMEFSRTPLDLMVYKNLGQSHSVGAGATYHLSPTFSCNIAIPLGCNYEEKADDALGFIAEYDYAFSEDDMMKIGVRYTAIEYKLTSGAVDGSALGVLFRLQLF